MPGTHDARERILSTAATLFYDHGIASTGVDTIARAAGVGKMSVYRHFRSKDDLVVAALDRQTDPNLDWLLPEAPAGERQVLDMFERIALAAMEPDFHGCPFVRAAIELPKEHSAQAVARRQRMHLTQRVEQHLIIAGISSPRLLAEQLVVLAGGAATECIVQGSTSPAIRAGEVARTVINASVEVPRDPARVDRRRLRTEPHLP